MSITSIVGNLGELVKRIKPENKGFLKIECHLEKSDKINGGKNLNSIVYFVTPDASRKLRLEHKKRLISVSYEHLCRIDERAERAGVHIEEVAGLVYFAFIPETIVDIYMRTAPMADPRMSAENSDKMPKLSFVADKTADYKTPAGADLFQLIAQEAEKN